MLAVDEKVEEVSVGNSNDGYHIQDVVYKRSIEGSREIVKKRCLTLGFHNEILQVFPPLFSFQKLLWSS